MRLIFSLLFLIVYANANTGYEKSTICKGCHPTIYNEFYGSAHRKSSIYEDEIHKAIWDMHPQKQKNSYTCSKCHTPTDLRLINDLKRSKTALPEKNAVQTKEAISCIYCHTIDTIEEHSKQNSNIMSTKNKLFFAANNDKRNKQVSFKEESSFFGMFKKKTGSPFHKIDYSNNNFYTGKICMGCHSHLKNKNDFDICKVEMSGAENEEKNCISCHMPKISGTATTIKITKSHSYHGFTGARNKPELLSKYIKIDLKKLSDGFEVIIKNEASHNLFLHPLRVARLNIDIKRDNKTIKLKSHSFVRILGDNNKPAMPWNATMILKDNMIKAGERRVIRFDTILQTKDRVEIQFGYFLVNPKVAEKLKLQDNKEAVKFNILKTKNFIID